MVGHTGLFNLAIVTGLGRMNLGAGWIHNNCTHVAHIHILSPQPRRIFIHSLLHPLKIFFDRDVTPSD